MMKTAFSPCTPASSGIGWRGTLVKEIEIISGMITRNFSVIFVDATPRSELSGEFKRTLRTTGLKIKVVEKTD